MDTQVADDDDDSGHLVLEAKGSAEEERSAETLLLWLCSGPVASLSCVQTTACPRTTTAMFVWL